MTQSILEQAPARQYSQPWLSSAGWDTLLIISPAFISSLIVILFANQFAGSSNLPLWAWVSFVLLVDVAHVYSTLFRTYFDANALRQNRGLLIAVPLVCWTVGAVLYSVDGLLFWKALAYLAVFHFIRQQFGFATLYSRKDPAPFPKFRKLDSAVIYLSTLYPILYWHTNMPRNFNWFIEGDFVEVIPPVATDIAAALYAIAAMCYIAKELVLFKTTGFFNIPRNLIIAGTALSWWIGIVAMNSDMAFTMTNVLAHGIPYMALIWLYQNSSSPMRRNGDSSSAGDTALSSSNKQSKANERSSAVSLAKQAMITYVPAFLFTLFLLAYLEEGLWDGFIWREHLSFFAPFANLPEIVDPAILAILIPLLSLPQSTHYVLDGFIWRVKDKKSVWTTN
jgi:hypothetical protein